MNAFAMYASGSGTSTLTFIYVGSSGEAAADLDYVSTDSLSLNCGTISDSAGNLAHLGLPSPGQPGSLGVNKDLVINTSGTGDGKTRPGCGLTGIELLMILGILWICRKVSSSETSLSPVAGKSPTLG